MKALRHILVRLGVIFFSLGLALLLAEGTLRWLNTTQGTSDIVDYDPLVGYHHKRNAKTTYRVNDRWISMNINAEGLRQNEEVYPKSEKEVRILALGDSFGFGWGVNYEESFTARLQEMARKEFPDWKINILNAGHGGWGTQQMLAFLEERGFSFEPDMVVTFMGPQDVEDNELVPLYKLNLDKSLNQKPRPISEWKNRSRLANLIPGYQWLLFNSHLVQISRVPVLTFINKIKWAFYDLNQKPHRAPPIPTLVTQFMYRKTDDLEHLTRSLLRRMAADCAERKIKFTVANVGQASDRTLAFLRMEPNFFVSEKVDYIDLLNQMTPEIIGDGSSPLFLKGDNHYNALGHQRYAHHAWPHLRARIQALIKEKVDKRERVASSR